MFYSPYRLFWTSQFHGHALNWLISYKERCSHVDKKLRWLFGTPLKMSDKPLGNADLRIFNTFYFLDFFPRFFFFWQQLKSHLYLLITPTSNDWMQPKFSCLQVSSKYVLLFLLQMWNGLDTSLGFLACDIINVYIIKKLYLSCVCVLCMHVWVGSPRHR